MIPHEKENATTGTGESETSGLAARGDPARTAIPLSEVSDVSALISASCYQSSSLSLSAAVSFRCSDESKIQTEDSGEPVRAGSLCPESDAPIRSPHPLGNRIDALVVAYRVHLSTDAKAELRRAVALAGTHGDAPLFLSGSELSPCVAAIACQKGERILFENDYLRGVFLEVLATEEPGWSLEVVARASWLAATPVEMVVAEIRRWAKAFGAVHEERLRRVDLAADFEGWPLREADGAAFVRHPRSTLVGHTDGNKPDVWGKIYRRASQDVTGFTICPGNPVMARLYDKTRELAVRGDESKAALERARWLEHGWGGGPVTRVEFQIRGEAAKELLGRSVDRLVQEQAGLWSYCTDQWLRLVVPGTASRLRRCEVDARWQVAQGVVWTGIRVPLVRRRTSGGAQVGQALGCALSALGLAGAMPDSADTLPETVDALLESFAPLVTENLVRDWGNQALAHLETKMATAVARAWKIELIPQGISVGESQVKNTIKWQNSVRVRAGETWALSVLPYATSCRPCGMKSLHNRILIDDVKEYGTVAALEIMGQWHWIAMVDDNLRFGDMLNRDDLILLRQTRVVDGNLSNRVNWWRKREVEM